MTTHLSGFNPLSLGCDAVPQEPRQEQRGLRTERFCTGSWFLRGSLERGRKCSLGWQGGDEGARGSFLCLPFSLPLPPYLSACLPLSLSVSLLSSCLTLVVSSVTHDILLQGLVSF